VHATTTGFGSSVGIGLVELADHPAMASQRFLAGERSTRFAPAKFVPGSRRRPHSGRGRFTIALGIVECSPEIVFIRVELDAENARAMSHTSPTRSSGGFRAIAQVVGDEAGAPAPARFPLRVEVGPSLLGRLWP
jgi:hypothetical protein